MSYMGSSRNNNYQQPVYSYPEKRNLYASPREKTKKKTLLWTGIVLGTIVVLAGIGIPVYLFLIKPHLGGASSSQTSSSNSTTNTAAKPRQTTGVTGSTILTEDGSSFTYTNPFGGFWIEDPNDPFNNNAQAQSYTPSLNQTWQWVTDPIRGVNVGGWLVLEPFIVPAMFQKYPGVVDEYDLSVQMAADTSPGGGISQIEDHYKTFITEQDFAEIAGAGLNWVRIPLPFWAIETWAPEPYLAKVGWTYFLKAISWARKYGLRINLDFHSVPGSQNGWNHSGKLGSVNWLNGLMGIANAQRSLTYIQTLVEFISQPRYSPVIPMFGVINEALFTTIGPQPLYGFYLESYNLIRQIGGVGVGNGPMISIHDGFQPLSNWTGLWPNADRIALDTHAYFAFGLTPSNATLTTWIQQPCKAWQPEITTSLENFGFTAAGEWSLAINDCGLNVNGVGLGTRYEGNYTGDPHPGVGSCTEWDYWETWTAETKSQFQQFALAEMDALQNWFFWTWKIGNSSVDNAVRAPFWSYQLGLQQGWMPTDPRQASGQCANAGFTGQLESWQTGGAGADQIPAATSAAMPWPPLSLNNAGPVNSAINNEGPVALLPSYTPTGTQITLPGPTFTPTNPSATISAGNGYFNPSVTTGAYVAIPVCTYYSEYDAVTLPPPTVACPPPAAKKDFIPLPLVTPAPEAFS